MNAIIQRPTYFNSGVSAAWTGIETVNAPTAEQAIKQARLDWEVEARPMYLGDGTAVPKARAIVRKDNGQVLGTVGRNYVPVQNKESLSFFDDVRAQLPGMSYVAAGSIDNGKRVWLLADFGGFDAQPGDEIRQQIMLYNSHDGSSALSYMFVPNRVFCNNQIAMILSGDKFLKIRHSKSANRRLDSARNVAHHAVAKYDNIEDMYKALARKPLTTEMLNTALDVLYPLKDKDGGDVSKNSMTRRVNIREEITGLVETGMGIGGRQRNAFSIYNAFTEYLTHHAQVNNGGGQERRWAVNTFGKGAREMRAVTEALIAA